MENDAGDGITVEGVEAGSDISCIPSDFELDKAFFDGPRIRKIPMQTSATAWERIRQELLRAVVEGEALPVNQVCTKCIDVIATLHCRKCGPAAFFCDTWSQQHKSISCCRGMEGYFVA